MPSNCAAKGEMMASNRIAGWMKGTWLQYAAFGAAMALTGFSWPLLAQPRPNILPPKKGEIAYSLTILTPEMADFDALLNEFFPGIQSLPYFQSMQPYLVLIRNDGAVPAVVYGIQWNVRGLDGSTTTLENDYIAEPLAGGPRLAPGGIRLLSPLFNLTPRQYQAAPSLLDSYAGAEFPALASCITEVDGVVYADFTYAGPQGLQMWQRYTAARLAAHDEVVSTLKLLNSSTAAQVIMATLNAEIERGRWSRGLRIMNMYVQARGQCAKTVRDLIVRFGQAEAQQILTRSNGSTAGLSGLGRHY